MHNLKLIKENPKLFVSKLKDKNAEIDINKLLELDEENRNLIQKKELLFSVLH